MMPEMPVSVSQETNLLKSESCQQTNTVTMIRFEDDDPENPRNWQSWRKWSIIGSVSCITFLSVFAPAAIAPAAPQIIDSFNVHSGVYRTLLITIWDLGEGISPFIVAPLAERYGRLPIYHIGNLLSVCCAVAGALSVNISMLIAFRFLSGLVLPVIVLGPVIVGDLFDMEDRGFVMSIMFGFIVLADFVSPIIGAYVSQAAGWRWILWLSAIAFGAFGLASLFVVRETYAEKILERKAIRTRRENRESVPTNGQTHYTPTIIQNFVRPIRIQMESPLVLLISLCTAVMYGLVSLVFATLTEVIEATYSISPGPVGLTYLSLAIGNLLATLFYSLTSDRNIKYQQKKKGLMFRPEARLVHLLLAATLFPCGFLLYGWTANFHIQFVVPLVGVAIVGAGLTFSLLATETYLVDIYETNAASAIAAGIALRTIFGTVLPLAAPALYRSIGLGWGNSVLALIAAILVPVLSMLIKYGEWFRSKGKVSQIVGS